MAADANSWLMRASAGRRQVAGDQTEALAVDQKPPIHAGSRVSIQLQEEFRRLLHAQEQAPAEDRSQLLASLEPQAPLGAQIIMRFASQIGEVRLGMPPPTGQPLQ